MTDGRIYMVKNGNEYDRYVSSLDTTGNHVWIPLGRTAVTIEIVDNLEDGGRDKALSAEQGKVLSEKIDGKFVFLTEEEFEPEPEPEFEPEFAEEQPAEEQGWEEPEVERQVLISSNSIVPMKKRRKGYDIQARYEIPDHWDLCDI